MARTREWRDLAVRNATPAEEIAAARPKDLAPPGAVLDYRLVPVQAERGDQRAGAVGRLWLAGYPGRVTRAQPGPDRVADVEVKPW